MPKPFEPGNTYGKNGRTPNSPELKAVQEFNSHSLNLMIAKMINRDPDEIKKEFESRKSVSMLERIILKVMQKAAQTGDPKYVNLLLERSLGKVAQPIEMPHMAPVQRVSVTIDVSNMDSDTLRQLEYAAEKDVTPHSE